MKNTFGLFIATAALAVGSLTAQAQAPTSDIPEEMNTLMSKYTCIACHRPNQRLVGPAYADVAKKKYTNAQIVELIYKPVPSHWEGYPPMAPMTQVPKEDALKLATWINSLDKTAKKSSKTTTKKTSTKKA